MWGLDQALANGWIAMIGGAVVYGGQLLAGWNRERRDDRAEARLARTADASVTSSTITDAETVNAMIMESLREHKADNDKLRDDNRRLSERLRCLEEQYRAETLEKDRQIDELKRRVAEFQTQLDEIKSVYGID